MKNILTGSFHKLAKSKYPKSETEPYNPWAVCNKSTGGKKEDPDKFERCVHHLKDQNESDNKKAETDDLKSAGKGNILGRPSRYRVDEYDPKKIDEEKEREYDTLWEEALRKVKRKDREPVMSFVVNARKK